MAKEQALNITLTKAEIGKMTTRFEFRTAYNNGVKKAFGAILINNDTTETVSLWFYDYDGSRSRKGTAAEREAVTAAVIAAEAERKAATSKGGTQDET